MSDTPIFDNVDDEYKDTDSMHLSKAPQPKVVAATVGAGVGSAVGEIVVWIVEASAAIDIPANVELAIGVVLTAGLAFVGGYWKKN